MGGAEDNNGAHGVNDNEEDAFKHKEERSQPFVKSHGITSAEAEELLRKWGRNELEEKTTPSWLIFLQQLYQPMPIMIWIAAIVEAAIENWIDFGILMGIQFANATLSWYETTKAGDAVAALKASLKPVATVKRDGAWKNINAGEVVPGDMVLLASGSAVPADCVVNHGQIDCDQSALTGESLPVTLYEGESAKMGATVVRGEVEATVEFTGKNTFFGKTAQLLNQGTELGHLQKILIKIMLVLVGLSFILCGTVLGYLLGMGEPFKEALSFTVVLLVASIPIAIEIVCTTTLALGSRMLSAEGAIVTRLPAIEDMAGMNMLCSDKTGTLTLNKMMIQEETPTFVAGMNQYQLLRMAALAAKWKEPPRDALDTLVLGAVDKDSLEEYTQTDFVPFDPTTKRTEGTLVDKSGAKFKTTKGAPNIIMKLCDDKQANAACESQVTALGKRGIRSLAVARCEVVNDEPQQWRLLGLLTFLDPPRPDTKRTIERALEFGVDVKMITGDHQLIAKETCRMLGMGTNVKDARGLPMLEDGKPPKDLAQKYGAMIMEADGFAQVYPEHKYLIVEALRQSGFAVGMTGDGVNDAPALKRADVGVAVQGATDAARAAADIVLTNPGLSAVIEAIIIARCIFQRMKNFINYRISATLQLLVFFFIAVLTLHPREYQTLDSLECQLVDPSVHHNDWKILYVLDGSKALEPGFAATVCNIKDKAITNCECVPNFCAAFDTTKLTGNQTWSLNQADCLDVIPPEDRGIESPWPHFFKMPVLMLMLITLLNDGTLISIGYDHVKPSHYPEKWNLPALFCISSILGAVACGSSILILWAALDSHNPDGLFAKWGMGKLYYGQIITLIYLKVSVSDFLTLFSARTHEGFFWSARPSPLLLGAALTALSLSTILACAWPKGKTDGIATEGLAYDIDPYNYTLMPLWVWLYCIVWWWIQDGLKVIGYWFMHTYNIFNINADKLVNMREATTADDKDHQLARQSVGHTESKLLEMKVQNAIDTVEGAIKEKIAEGGAQAKNLQRISNSLGLVRTSVSASRQGGPSGAKAGAEGGSAVEAVQAQIAQLEETVKQAGDALGPEIQVQLEGVKATANRLGLARTSATGKK